MLAIIGISHEKTWQLGSDSQGPDMKEPYRKETKGHCVGYNRNISREDLAAGVG